MDVKQDILDKKIQIAVIGLGYVGLPLSVALARQDYKVIGIDYNASWVERINQGISNIIDVSSESLKQVIDRGLLSATTDYSQSTKAGVIIICVPTPLNKAKEPDLSYIVKAIDGILPYLQKQVVISLESTTYPGTTEELITRRIEREKDWIVGKDFYVCYSPERVDPGNKSFSVENTPKVVGGSTKTCLEVGMTLYQTFLPKVVGVKSTQVAEMSKLLENTFRCVNIALINEMTMMCERMNIDVWEVIKAASSKPFGFMPFYPGPGVGGHCIPLDPLYLYWEAKKYNYFNRFIETASDINNNMPYYVVGQIERLLNKIGKPLRGSMLLLVGMSYKKDISDLRESPSLEVYELLIKRGAKVKFYDPNINEFKSKTEIVRGIELNSENVSNADVVVILSDHDNLDYIKLVEDAKVIYDTRNACEGIENEKIIKLGQNLED